MLLLQRVEEMEGGGGPNPGICSSSPSDWQAGVHFAATLPSERWGGVPTSFAGWRDGTTLILPPNFSAFGPMRNTKYKLRH